MEVVGPDLRTWFDDNGNVLDYVLELAYVPAPGVGAQRPQRCIGQAREGRALAAMADPIGGKEVVREQRDVLRPLPQRGHVDRYHPQAIIQIFPHVARLDRRFGVDVGGGDEPHVHHGVRCLASDAAYHAVLNDPE